MIRMLEIQHDRLPQSLLSYVAFRVALRDTWDRFPMPRRGIANFDESGLVGYLAEVPFLREVPLPVQCEVLARTWRRHLAPELVTADLLDESILYAVCERTSTLIETQPERVIAALRGGPLDLAVPIDHHLAREIRGLYLKLSNEGEFLLISQLLDLPPEAADHWKQRLGIDNGRLDVLFDLLGRWHADRDAWNDLSGLANPDEITAMRQTLSGSPAVA